LKRDHLKAFVSNRTQKYLRIALTVRNLNKSTSEDLRDGTFNCFVNEAKDVANQPDFADKPDIPIPQFPQSIGLSSVGVVKFS
jgi:hypothetical protein